MLRSLVFLAIATAAGPAPARAGGAAKPVTTPSTPAKADRKIDPKVDIVKLTAQPALVRRVRARPTELEAQLKTAIFAMIAEATAGGLDLAGPPFVRYHARGDAPDAVWDVEAGLPVIKAPAAAPSPATQLGALPAGDAATVIHVGPHTQLPAAHDALAAWVARQRRRAAGPAWEVYLTNPVTMPDPARQRTKLFLPLAPVGPGAASK